VTITHENAGRAPGALGTAQPRAKYNAVPRPRGPTVKTDIGRVFTFLEHRTPEWGRAAKIAIWLGTCANCDTEFEITSPRIVTAHGHIDAQMAFRSGVWRKYFSVARCSSCRQARRRT